MQKTYLFLLGFALFTIWGTVHSADKLSPEDSNPVNTEIMQGFPPANKHLITRSTMMEFPNLRWSFHHIRELLPTANVAANSENNITKLEEKSEDVRNIKFSGPDNEQHTVGEWLDNTYTDGFIVLHKGDIAYEHYAKGIKPDEPHLVMSNTKSIIGLLAADLIAQGKLDPQAPVTQYIPELKNSAWEKATVQQTLDMLTDIDFTERYSDPDSDINKYTQSFGLTFGSQDSDKPRSSVYKYLQALNGGSQRGKKFVYQTVNPEVIGWIIQRISGKNLNEVLSDRIWKPMGAEFDGYFIIDSVGTAMSGGGFNATLRDMARFAEMIRQRGRYNSQRILDDKVFNRVFAHNYDVTMPAEDYGAEGRQDYAYHNFWWLPNGGDGSAEMWGIYGQIVHINPQAGTVIVKQSSRPDADNGPRSAMAIQAFKAIDKALSD